MRQTTQKTILHGGNRKGVTVCSLGKHGGVRLARPAEPITLGDIYRAITDKKKLLAARPDVPSLGASA